MNLDCCNYISLDDVHVDILDIIFDNKLVDVCQPLVVRW